jgi:hypothetical protein
MLGGLAALAVRGRAGAAPSCREAGHPCEGDQTCCDQLVCVVSGPGNARRCTSCPAGTVFVGGTCCTPVATCPAGQACGTAPDGCGGTLACGTCAACQICGSGNTCVTAADGSPCPGGVCCAGTCQACCTDADCPASTNRCSKLVCAAGQCRPTVVVCPPPDPCHDPGACDPATGVCSNPAKPDGTPCDSGDKCTTGDTCRAGVCTAGRTRACANATTCGTFTCNPATGQCDVFHPNPDATPCDDGNACTQGDTCIAGVCTGGNPVVCPPAIDACHLQGSCDPATGTCTNPPAPVGTACGMASCSGSTLTPRGECDGAGTCTPGTPSPCPLGFACASATACAASCAGDAQCAAGFTCAGGVCAFAAQGTCAPGADTCQGTGGFPCNGNANCLCATTAERATVCFLDNAAETCGGCVTSAECPPGWVCIHTTGSGGGCFCPIGANFCRPLCPL